MGFVSLLLLLLHSSSSTRGRRGSELRTRQVTHVICQVSWVRCQVSGVSCQVSTRKSYPKDPKIVPYTLATLKCSHALTSWTFVTFFKLISILGQVVIQSKKIVTRVMGHITIVTCHIIILIRTDF